MGLSSKIVSILVGAGVLTIWRLTEGEKLFEQWLIEREICELMGPLEIFGSYVMLFVSGVIITYVLLFGIRRRRHSEV